MRRDEYQFILGEKVDFNLKRRKFLNSKWTKRGWLKDERFTDEFYRIQELSKKFARHYWEDMHPLDGHVVIVNFIDFPPAIGILEDNGDNGWWFYTRKSCKRDMPEWFNYYLRENRIVYIEKHPNPAKIWGKLNYLFWKNCNRSDRFHQKINTMSYGVVCDYSQANLGIFKYSHPDGNIGDCFPCCQCKTL